MKRFLLACAIFLAPAGLALGQQTAVSDTGAVPIPGQSGTATDSGTTSIPPSESTSADTTPPAVVPPLQNTVPPAADTGAVPTPPDTGKPADTTAIPPAPPPQPRETEPAPVTPQPETPPPQKPGEGEEGGGAQKPPNRFALGLIFNDDAPLSARTWFNAKVGLDVGLGINLRQVQDIRVIPANVESTTTFLDLNFDLGLPVRVIRHDKVDLIVRPGFGFRTRPEFDFSIEDPSVRSVETTLELEVNGTIGFEYYPFEKASFGFHTGVALVETRPSGARSTSLKLESLPKGATNFAFRYYIF